MIKLFANMILFLFCVSIGAQSTVRFEYKVEPDKVYTSEVTTAMDGTIQIEADETTMDKMREMGMEYPMKMVQQSNMVLVNTTYGKDDQGRIPAMLYYDKMETKMEMGGNPITDQGNMFDGLKIYGSYGADHNFAMDSIQGSITDQVRGLLESMLKQLQNQIVFPERPIGVGDTFKNEVPMSIPMGPTNPIDIMITSIYTLRNIQNGLAYFDVAQSIALNTTSESMNMTASGKGKGTLEYDIEKSFTKRYTTDLPMKMQMTMPNMMKMEMDMNTKTTVDIGIQKRE